MILAHLNTLPHLHADQVGVLVAVLTLSALYCWLTRKANR
jgi:hypothetical protein